ncbi:hypothetical protein [Thiomicrospira aerophila]|nr:hypothetical protein [Thiomicrospira aerophila]
MKKESEKVGHYVCALVDILGQKVELNKLDDIESIRNQHDEVLKICRNAYGKVKILRKAISESDTYLNSFAKRCEKSPRIKNTFFSDLIVMHLSLSKGGEAFDICRLVGMLLSLAEVFLVMLAKGIPLRGGVDVGIAIESQDGQLYGRALSKTYELESNVAQSIRIVIGQELVDLLDIAACDSQNEFYDDAKFCRLFIKKDTDSVYILDYLAKPLHQLTDFVVRATKAIAFLEGENNRFRKCGDYKTASKYEKALKYFENSGVA